MNNSSTYKIISNLGSRWNSTNNQAERDRLHGIAEDTRAMERAGTPYMYGQDKVIVTLQKNAVEGIDKSNELIMRSFNAGGSGNPILSSYLWFVDKTCSNWDYKWSSYWQVPYDTFNGVDMHAKQKDGGYPRNWIPWIYFDGMLMGADKFGNLNLGYVGYRMEFDGYELLNPATSGAGDGFWVKYGIDMAKQGR